MQYYKFPRTPHLPWSPGWTGDDVRLINLFSFNNKDLVVLEKRDGENTTITSDGKYYARSVDSGRADWRDHIGKLTAEISYQLPEGWRICGENMFAIHSVEYKDLKSYFEVFAIFNEQNEEISWNETKEWCELLGLSPVPEIGRFRVSIENPEKNKDHEHYLYCFEIESFNFGDYFEERFKPLLENSIDETFIEALLNGEKEGFVLRNANAFPYEEYSENVAKFVRAGHVQTDKHWTKNWRKAELVK
jgi:hypothetical protein